MKRALVVLAVCSVLGPLAGPLQGRTIELVVEPELVQQLSTELALYRGDLAAAGYAVIQQPFTGSVQQLRNHLQQQYQQTAGDLVGAVLIGDLPYCSFTTEDDFGNGHLVTYPHDLYLMDLDGTYSFGTGPGGTDEHTGPVGPEIFVSRIQTSNLPATGKSEAQLISDYLHRTHDYRTGQRHYASRGAVFADDDWSYWGGETMAGLYDEMLVVNDPNQTTRQAYVDLLGEDVESLLTCIHSSATTHYIEGVGSGNITSAQLVQINPHAGFVNNYNCSAGNFTHDDYLAGVYVFGSDYGLASVASSKTGAMLYFSDFYGPQADGASFGQAFVDWFDLYAAPTDDPAQDWKVDWFYGMTLFGDVTLVPTQMGDPSDPLPPLSGDIDGNGVVDGLDLTCIMSSFGSSIGDDNYDPAADVDGNGVVDGLDLTVVLAEMDPAEPTADSDFLQRIYQLDGPLSELMRGHASELFGGVPEPATVVMLLAGLLLTYRRRGG